MISSLSPVSMKTKLEPLFGALLCSHIQNCLKCCVQIHIFFIFFTHDQYHPEEPDQQMEAALCLAVQLLFCFLQENLDFQSVLSLLRYS